MITKKQIEKLAMDKLGPRTLHEYPTINGWYADLAPSSFTLFTCAPTRAVARAGLNAMLFALPKRERAAR